MLQNDEREGVGRAIDATAPVMYISCPFSKMTTELIEYTYRARAITSTNLQHRDSGDSSDPS